MFIPCQYPTQDFLYIIPSTHSNYGHFQIRGIRYDYRAELRANGQTYYHLLNTYNYIDKEFMGLTELKSFVRGQ